MLILNTNINFFWAEQPLPGQPVQHALCSFYHSTNRALPARLCLPAKKGKKPIRVDPLFYGLCVLFPFSLAHFQLFFQQQNIFLPLKFTEKTTHQAGLEEYFLSGLERTHHMRYQRYIYGFIVGEGEGGGYRWGGGYSGGRGGGTDKQHRNTTTYSLGPGINAIKQGNCKDMVNK